MGILFIFSGKFEDELTPLLKHTGAGILSMVYYNYFNRRILDLILMEVNFLLH